MGTMLKCLLMLLVMIEELFAQNATSNSTQDTVQIKLEYDGKEKDNLLEYVLVEYDLSDPVKVLVQVQDEVKDQTEDQDEVKDQTEDQDEDDVKKFVEDAETQLEKARISLEFSAWNYKTNLTDYNQKAELESQKSLSYLAAEIGLAAKKFNASQVKDPVVQRKLQFITPDDGNKNDPKLASRHAELFSQMGSIFAKAKVETFHDRNQSISLEPDIYTILTKSRDPEELEHYWMKWRDSSGKLMREKYIEQAKIQNIFNGANCQEDQKNYEKEVEEIWQGLKPLYVQLHTFARTRLNQKYGDNVVKKTGPIPAHLLGNMWAQHWNNIYDIVIPFPNKPILNVTAEMQRQRWTPTRMFKTAENLFTSIGFDSLPQEFWSGSMLVKPKDREAVCHASAWDMGNRKDYRIKMCTEVDGIYLHDIHHEMGHIYYDISFKDQPFLFRGTPDMGFHEASGDTIALTVETGKYQKHIGLLPDSVDIEDKETDLNILMNMALQKIAFLPFGYLIEKFRWDIASHKTDLDNMNCHWWKLRHEYQGIAPPKKRSYLDFDPGAKSHIATNIGYIRYFRAHMYQFQFYKTLCELAGEYVSGDASKPLHRCSIFGSVKAGEKLREAFSLGKSVEMDKILTIMTGKPKIDTGALREYFRPLEDWLTQENQRSGAQVGWGDLDLSSVCEQAPGSHDS